MNNIKQTATKVDLWATWCDLVVIGIKAFMGTLTTWYAVRINQSRNAGISRKRRASEFSIRTIQSVNYQWRLRFWKRGLKNELSHPARVLILRTIDRGI